MPLIALASTVLWVEELRKLLMRARLQQPVDPPTMLEHYPIRSPERLVKADLHLSAVVTTGVPDLEALGAKRERMQRQRR